MGYNENSCNPLDH